jgi:hypothetical protein
VSSRGIWPDWGDDTPDGICVDAQLAVWYAYLPNKRCVRVTEGGTILQTVDVDRGFFACTLGGADGTTIFIAAARWRACLRWCLCCGDLSLGSSTGRCYGRAALQGTSARRIRRSTLRRDEHGPQA